MHSVTTASLSGADTAWVLTSTALVLFMTLPGLALFYSGLVRGKNSLSILVQCFAITCLATLLWFAVGYSMTFRDGGDLQGLIGGFDRLFFAGVARDSLVGTIPEPLFAMFQMTFAIITPALVIGGYAERVRGCTGSCAHHWQAPRLPACADATPQPAAGGLRCGHAVGGLVRLQRRQ